MSATSLKRLSLAFALAVLLSSPLTDCASIWIPHIDEGPAPSPEDGPPFSANASRDPSLIPAQVGGIVGAYLFSLLVISICLLFIGRRLRRAAESSPKTLDMEMVKPSPGNVFRSPEGKESHRIWPSPDSTASAHVWPSPQQAFGWSRSSKNKQLQEDRQPLTPRQPVPPASFDSRVIEEDREQRAADLERLYAAVLQEDTTRPLAAGQSPAVGSNSTRERPKLASLNTTVTRIPDGDTLRSPVKPEPRSPLRSAPIEMHARNGSTTSIPSVRSARSNRLSKLRGARNLEISSPLPSSGQVTPCTEDYDKILPPRDYNPPGPPPPVPRLAPISTNMTSVERFDAQRSPTSPLSPNATNFSRPSPSRHHPLADRSLPLRHPDSAGSSVKTTVLERSTVSVDIRSPRFLGAPRTGVPSTPYSPYMPFTPMTPVTPRLVTKQERKRREREEGRRVAIKEKDEVLEEKELWDSGY